MFNERSAIQKAAITSAAVALLYVAATLIMASSWKGSVAAFLAGASSADGNNLSNPNVLQGMPDLPFLLSILMRPIPMATGDGLTKSWPILLQGGFIFASLFAFVRCPRINGPLIVTAATSLVGLWLILFLLSGRVGASLGFTLLYGIPLIGLLALVGTFVGERVLSKPDAES